MTAIDEALQKAKKVLRDNFIVEPPVNVEELAKNSGIDVQIVQFPHSYSNVSGFINLERGKPVVYVNADDSSSRQKFTIAHELGHWLLHEDSIRNDPQKAILFRIAIGVSNNDPLEKQANAFAAELLVPMEIFNPIKDRPVRKLADKFEVSTDVIGFRKVAAEHVEKTKTVSAPGK